MARLPDYRAQRGLDTGAAQQLSVDTSRLQRLDEFGRAVENAGQTTLKVAEQRAERDAKQGVKKDTKTITNKDKEPGMKAVSERLALLQERQQKTEASERFLQLNADMEQALETMVHEAPQNGRDVYKNFMVDVFDVGVGKFLDDVPESQQAEFQKRIAQDGELFAQKAAKLELKQGRDHAAQVVGLARDDMLTRIRVEGFEPSAQRFLEIAQASPLPAPKIAEIIDEGLQSSHFQAVRNSSDDVVAPDIGTLLG